MSQKEKITKRNKTDNKSKKSDKKDKKHSKKAQDTKKTNGKTNGANGNKNGNGKTNGNKNGNGGLSDKQEQYCIEFLVDYNQTQAAIRAGYTKASARNAAYRLMINEDVQARIKELAADYLEDRKVLAVRTLRELEAVGTSDITHFIQMGAKNTQTEIKDLDKIDTRAIAALDVNEKILKDKKGNITGIVERIVKIKLWDKPRSLETLSKVTELQPNELTLKGSVNLKADIEGWIEIVRKKLLKNSDDTPKVKK